MLAERRKSTVEKLKKASPGLGEAIGVEAPAPFF
jgi:hypothetical protein